MNLDGRRIWQVAAGDTNRDYADVLLDWDVIAMGPGRYGAWPDCQDGMRSDTEADWTERKIGGLRCFCEEIVEGDVIVLRLGTSVVRGVGLVEGDYRWHDAFGDLDGWDLQHIHRVRWLWRGTKSFPPHTLKFGLTVQPLDARAEPNRTVRSWLEELEFPVQSPSRSLRELPEAMVQEASLEEVADFLFDRGVASGSVKALLAEMDDLVRIARWYARMRNKPSEHETVAYLVIPLLRALGWTPQKMGIEWNFVDIALFDFLPRLPQYLTGVVEAKKWGDSCLTAHSQASEYAKQHGGTLCERLIVTDGMRYGVFLRHQHDLVFEGLPDAYLNLIRLRWEYPLLNCAGAGAGLRMMAADFRRLEGPNEAWRNVREIEAMRAYQDEPIHEEKEV